MATVIKGSSLVSRLVKPMTLIVDGDFNPKFFYAVNISQDKPFESDISLVTNAEIIECLAYEVSGNRIGIQGSKSLPSPVSYSRLYIVNANLDILYCLDISPESKSEIVIDILIELKDSVQLLGL